MKIHLRKFILLGAFVCLYVPASAQVFIAEAVFNDFFVEGDIVTIMEQAGYTTTSPSELPEEIGVPTKKLTDYLDQYIEDVKKLYYINESNGSIMVCAVTRKSGYFVYAVNFFDGNNYAVDRIKDIFIENELTFDHEENGQYIYTDGEDAGGLVAIMDNGVVMFGYFEL
jgi:hypothetical protein